MAEETLAALRIDRNAPHRPRTWRRRLLLAAGVLAIAGLALVLLQTQPVKVVLTKVTQAWPAQGLTALNATGYVVADTKASVASKATGRLEWLGVREGSAIKAGELIARLENGEVRAQLAQAEANVAAAQARVKQAEADQVDADFNWRRQQALKAQGFVAQANVDAAQNRALQARAAVAAQAAAVHAAQASVTEIKVALENTLIRAPFSGVVLTKQADVGDVVTPLAASSTSKAAVVTMADLTTLEIEADVSETSLAKAHLDQAVEIQFDALPDLRLAGHVARIVPTVDRSKATVKFKIRFDEHDPRVLPDMSAKIAFLTRPLQASERQPRIALSPAAIEAGKVFVVAQDNTLTARPVATGMRLGDLVEVVQGLKPGERVVAKPTPGLRDGLRIEEQKP